MSSSFHEHWIQPDLCRNASKLGKAKALRQITARRRIRI
jgi:hypothetical protein